MHVADPAIALLGGMQSLFEASMYSFVFLWTMAMSPNKEAIKHGLIFVNFMTACMAGSFLAGGLVGVGLLDRCNSLRVKCVLARSIGTTSWGVSKR
jgi:hypothetical protein